MTTVIDLSARRTPQVERNEARIRQEIATLNVAYDEATEARCKLVALAASQALRWVLDGGPAPSEAPRGRAA